MLLPDVREAFMLAMRRETRRSSSNSGASGGETTVFMAWPAMAVSTRSAMCRRSYSVRPVHFTRCVRRRGAIRRRALGSCAWTCIRGWTGLARRPRDVQAGKRQTWCKARHRAAKLRGLGPSDEDEGGPAREDEPLLRPPLQTLQALLLLCRGCFEQTRMHNGGWRLHRAACGAPGHNGCVKVSRPSIPKEAEPWLSLRE